MSTAYGAQDRVPTEVLIARLEELSRAVTEGRDAVSREFTMRVPAEMDRDADLVLHAAACRLREYLTPTTPTEKEIEMHYRNGREAKNGDKIVKLDGGKVVAFGVLHSATPGNDYCNGNIAVVQSATDYACMCDCLHIDDVAEVLATQGLDKRPEGK